MKRLGCLWLAAVPAFAQLQVFTVHGLEERAGSGPIQMGTTATGEPLEVVMRIRNTTALLATIQTLQVEGSGFTLQSAPRTPVSLVGGFSLDFYVRFLSDRAVTDARANLRIDSITITLSANASAAPNLYLLEEDGSRTRRLAGVSSVFANVERGGRSARVFVLENPGDTALTTRGLAVSGEFFQLAAAVGTPFDLAPRAVRTFEIAFQPASSGLKRGELSVDQRRYPLEGVGMEPPLPKPSISVSGEIRQSGKQVRVSVQFESAARGSGAGRLRAEFTQSVSGPEDPAILFTSTNSRTTVFEVRPDESQALFGAQREVILQTGATAGTLRLVAEMGGYTVESSYVIAPAPVVMDTLAVRRGIDILEVTVKGFDNSRSASETAFTFFDREGRVVQPGELRSTVADKFRTYYETAPAGGMFSMQAVFPATGTTVQIAGAEVEFRNSAGVSRSARLNF